MSNTSNNKQDDTDVIRAEDIVPPYEEKHREQDLPAKQASRTKDILSQEGQKQTLKEEASSLSESRPQHVETGATEPGDVVLQINEIPKFDLAEQIMAEQRKITAIRRKAPGQKSKTPDQRPRIQSTGYAIKPPPTLSQKELIIAEIVARDIEKLYRGDSSST